MMREAVYRRLKVSQEFRRLTAPISRERILEMERELLSGREPPLIPVWNDVILDGYAQYELCQKHDLPFFQDRKSFSCREAAAAWICARQLERESLTDEMRRFLIGTRYLLENRINRGGGEKVWDGAVGRGLAAQLGREYHVSLGSVERYTRFARALERMRPHVPSLVDGILAGQIRLPQEEVAVLSRLEGRTLQNTARQLERSMILDPACRDGRIGREETPLSVKDMPAFDPDAELTSLILTVPSWSGSIDRMRSRVRLRDASEQSKSNLKRTLEDLRRNISNVLSEIEEI